MCKHWLRTICGYTIFKMRKCEEKLGTILGHTILYQLLSDWSITQYQPNLLILLSKMGCLSSYEHVLLIMYYRILDRKSGGE